ncbi:DUF6328 family protein [Arthrobacter sp. B2a2-09]|uniref:DUF6328 family protein n=1 Tax=Arthrobacter sp. B2a2-09 TaxID=2952822 RepID=UPI0022CD3177|nr:DUF6328 family protein [Arthrobacter sp. B2a2-09]
MIFGIDERLVEGHAIRVVFRADRGDLARHRSGSRRPAGLLQRGSRAVLPVRNDFFEYSCRSTELHGTRPCDRLPTAAAVVSHPEDPLPPGAQADTRHESEDQRMDRNWNELLQELRVLQTGAQIIGGFLLTLPFQQRFSTLTELEKWLHLVLVVLATMTTGLMLVLQCCSRAAGQNQNQARSQKTSNPNSGPKAAQCRPLG